MTSTTLITTLAFGLGLTFGALTTATRFCTMGAVADIVSMNDWSRMRMWALAILVAMLGTQAMSAAGLIDLSKTFYTSTNLRWASHIVGGLMFGIGMPLASGCGARVLTRLGGGNLKSLVVLVFFGLSAYMALRGIFGVWRSTWLDPMSINLPATQDLGALAAALWGMTSNAAVALASLVVSLPLAVFIFRRGYPGHGVTLGGAGVGLCVLAGWWISGHLGYVAEHPDTLQEAFIATDSGRMESLSFAAPVAYSLELLMLWSDASRTLSFGVAAALGVITGAALHALATKQFRLESFAGHEDLARHLIGAMLMGAGGVTALGCTIGQGVSGVSTLALGSIITLAAILLGCALMMKFDEWRLMREA
ncbi:MAG: hypothetical protein RIR70_236 [Pseudomonadota bacterium]|jgi:uncharacterized membrane protein YedE/YeeE